MKAPVLVTGSNGFIGTHLRRMMASHNIAGRYAVRASAEATVIGSDPEQVLIGDIDEQTDWREALAGVEVVIHLAGRAHILRETHADPLKAFRQVNTAGTLRLAEQMREMGCRRLVFVSTIGVNGDSTPIDQPFTEMSTPAPAMPYALAKWEAERGLDRFRDELEIVILRPPLVYGAGAAGNFGRLLRLVQSGIPLPLGAARNLRSLVAVQNLCDFVLLCAQHPLAAGESYLISDGEDLSTPQLLRAMAAASGRSIRLLPIPEALMRLPLRAVGRERIVNQLFGSLVVDSSKARESLGWRPIVTVQEALAALQEDAR